MSIFITNYSNRLKTKELRSECDSFEKSQKIRIANFDCLKSYLFGDNDIRKYFLEKELEIMKDISFFNIIWESLKKVDVLYEFLAGRNKIFDEIVSPDSNQSEETHLKNIESLMERKIEDLYHELNTILQAESNFTVPDSERLTSISRILNSMRKEFEKFQKSIKKVKMKNIQ